MPVLPEPERYVIPLAAYLALCSYTSTQSDPTGHAESAFLTLLITGVLAATAAIGVGSRGGRGTPELAVAALLATATVWIAYQGPSRGAVVCLILVVALAVSAARALLDERGRLRAGVGLELGVTAPLALGLQLLTRGDLLLADLFEPRTLASLLALPLVAAGALSVLASCLGRRRVLLAGGLVVVLAPGWTVTSTLALVALAAGAMISDTKWPKILRWTAVATLALLPFWNLPKGLLFAVGGVALAASSFAAASLLPIAVLAVVLLIPRVHAPIEAIGLWVGGLVLVPGAVLAKPSRRWQVRLGVILILAAALVAGAPEAMAAGVALAAFAVPTGGAAAALGRAWCAILVIGTTLLAAYPWVRDDPRGDLLALLGFDNLPLVPLRGNQISALFILLVLIGLGFGIDRYRDAVPRWARWATRPAVAGLAACLLLAGMLAPRLVPATVLVNSYGPATIDADSDHWQQQFSPQEVSGMALDSHLAGAVEIPRGTVVAVVELRAGDGAVLGEWPLRVGFETAEWASSRPDIAGRPGFAAPAPWISRVAPGGTVTGGGQTSGFFAHRYRSHFTVPSSKAPAIAASRIAIRRGGGLPPETRLSIYRLELRR